jgi:hypothetical protein
MRSALKSAWVFVRDFWGIWGPLMSGTFSVPFAALAVFGKSEYAARIYGTMAYAALFVTCILLWRRLKRPYLNIQFDPENIRECTLGTPPNPKQFRIKVSNLETGKTIRNCQGRIEFVESTSLPQAYVEKVPLTWSLQVDQDRTDLQDGQSLPLNVIVVGMTNTGDRIAHFIARSDANNAPHPFNFKAEYRCVVAVTSDDTTPKYVDFIFDWTGNPATARIKDVSFSNERPSEGAAP